MELGAQLYVFGETYDLTSEIDGILRDVAHMGYKGVEGAPGMMVDFSDALRRNKLAYFAAHFGLAGTGSIQDVAEYLRTMDACEVCVSSRKPMKTGKVETHYAQLAQQLNHLGAEFRKSGIFLHYHNHAFEFRSGEGTRSGMDVLLSELDAEAVDLCLDVGWAAVAGVDLSAFLAQNGGRIGYIHLRDFRNGESVPLGEGNIGLDRIIVRVAELPMVRRVVVEQSPSLPHPTACMRKSRLYLQDCGLRV